MVGRKESRKMEDKERTKKKREGEGERCNMYVAKQRPKRKLVPRAKEGTEINQKLMSKQSKEAQLRVESRSQLGGPRRERVSYHSIDRPDGATVDRRGRVRRGDVVRPVEAEGFQTRSKEQRTEE